MQGFLHKKCRTKSGWTHRFFVIRSDGIYWFSKPSSQSYKGSLKINASTSITPHESRAHAFTISSGGEDLTLAADTDQEVDAWNLAVREVQSKVYCVRDRLANCLLSVCAGHEA